MNTKDQDALRRVREAGYVVFSKWEAAAVFALLYVVTSVAALLFFKMVGG